MMKSELDLKSRDFRDIWPYQAKTILQFSAMLQKQCQFVHQQTLASSRTASQDLKAASVDLSEMASKVSAISKSTQQQCTRSMKELESAVISRVNHYMHDHSRLSEEVLAQIDELRKRERRYMKAREEFLTLPWWRRLWGGNTLPSL